MISDYPHLQRAAHSFQPQMKLEAVDKRSPGLIRVATVEEVDTHRIKVKLNSLFRTKPGVDLMRSNIHMY